MTLRTRTYFDSRPDARYFMVDVDGVAVSVRENLPTHGVTDGEVWIAVRIHDRCIERRFPSVSSARRELARFVRALLSTRADAPTIGAWIPILREEYVVACPVCKAAPAQPCFDEVDDDLIVPFVHVGRCTAHQQSLRGGGRRKEVSLRGETNEAG